MGCARSRESSSFHVMTLISLTNVTWTGDEMRSRWESICSVMMKLCRNQYKLTLLLLLLWAESESEFDFEFGSNS